MQEHPDSPYIRAIGFLYLRVGMADGFKELWSWYEPYLGDTDTFEVDGTPATKTTFSEWLRRLLTDQARLPAPPPTAPPLPPKRNDKPNVFLYIFGRL